MSTGTPRPIYRRVEVQKATHYTEACTVPVETAYGIDQIPVLPGEWLIHSDDDSITVRPDQIGNGQAYQAVKGHLCVVPENSPLVVPRLAEGDQAEEGEIELVEFADGDEEPRILDRQSLNLFLRDYAPCAASGELLAPPAVRAWHMPMSFALAAVLGQEGVEPHEQFLLSIRELDRQKQVFDPKILNRDDRIAVDLVLADHNKALPKQIYGQENAEGRMDPEAVPGQMRRIAPLQDEEADISVMRMDVMKRRMGGERNFMWRISKQLLGGYCPLQIEDVSVTMCSRYEDAEWSGAKALYDYVVNHPDARDHETPRIDGYVVDSIRQLDTDGMSLLAVSEPNSFQVYGWPHGPAPRVDLDADGEEPDGPAMR